MASESPDASAHPRAAIARHGSALGPAVLAECTELFHAAQERLALGCPAAATEVAYGEHPRQRLDVYLPAPRPQSCVPVFVWVHGGGFVRGEKSSPSHPFNAHVGRWAARSGFMGVVMNYRLAPQAQWPSGALDLAAVIDWLASEAVHYGGDAQRVMVAGSSAGAVHVGTYLQLHAAKPRVRGAVLLSGLYGATALSDSDRQYYGSDPTQDTVQASLASLAAGTLPLFIACAEFDPPRFQAESLELLRRTLEYRGSLPRAYIASGHNHYTLAMHLGTADTRLSDEILCFATSCCSV